MLTENLRRDLATFVAEVEAWADELDSYEALDPEGRVEIVRDAAAFRVMLQRVATDCPADCAAHHQRVFRSQHSMNQRS